MDRLGATLNIFKEGYKWFKYWKDFKGKRIVIVDEKHSFDEENDKIKKVSFIIEGKIEEVILLPPCFKLIDVKEYTKVRVEEGLFGAGTEKQLDIQLNKEFKSIVKEESEKYVSFSSINHLKIKQDS